MLESEAGELRGIGHLLLLLQKPVDQVVKDAQFEHGHATLGRGHPLNVLEAGVNAVRGMDRDRDTSLSG